MIANYYRSSKFKSLTAANAVKRMNPEMHINARVTKVAEETEAVFNAEFWSNVPFFLRNEN